MGPPRHARQQRRPGFIQGTVTQFDFRERIRLDNPFLIRPRARRSPTRSWLRAATPASRATCTTAEDTAYRRWKRRTRSRYRRSAQRERRRADQLRRLSLHRRAQAARRRHSRRGIQARHLSRRRRRPRHLQQRLELRDLGQLRAVQPDRRTPRLPRQAKVHAVDRRRPQSGDRPDPVPVAVRSDGRQPVRTCAFGRPKQALAGSATCRRHRRLRAVQSVRLSRTTRRRSDYFTTDEHQEAPR